MNKAKKAIESALTGGRFPHALLIYGAPGLGQHALALDVAQILLCEHPEKRPCDTCSSCIGFKALSLENLYHLLPIKKAGKSDADGEGLDAAAVDEFVERVETLHEKPYGFEWVERSSIFINQVRELQHRLAYAESRGRPRIILLCWLEALRPEAANALLKTLEEPPKDTLFVITSEDRGRLLPTLLSRCQHIPLSPMSHDELQQALTDWKEMPEGGVKQALIPLAEGAPGAYLEMHAGGGEGLLEESGRFLAAALELDFHAFAQYLEETAAFSDAEGAVRVLEAALRLVRLHHRFAALSQGEHTSYRTTHDTLLAEGFDPGLQGALAPLEKVTDLTAFAAYLEDSIKAVRAYVKPINATLGLFLEYEAKARKSMASAT